ncbi:hypothetical protein J437_LFUL000236 [Ladona fulva]|uniref:Bis(5'-nucleosyl)-tetraphosphatase [asymmetrical] n=1 Tax=Ladona fulva TaxID=123851 RepID=A0A8K0JV35_LADFU|nr:hypothetical protein J437_LFUL000236 [Ladona fulva]
MRRAAGLVIYRLACAKVEYLLLQTSYGEHHWTPPKGHVDPGESDMETALRETEEESGLKKSDLRIYEDFKETLEYKVKGKPKIVIYWLAELSNANAEVKLSREHQDYKWLPLDDACKIAGYKDMIDLLHKCEHFLTAKKSSN